MCDRIPGSEHHIKEEWEQIIHAPEEATMQQRFHLQGQLLKRLLDHHQLV